MSLDVRTFILAITTVALAGWLHLSRDWALVVATVADTVRLDVGLLVVGMAPTVALLLRHFLSSCSLGRIENYPHDGSAHGNLPTSFEKLKIMVK
jgi:hypothetical protein